ncbi:hypothetical protein P886_4683 [Alteromonadaceae bacterium 2753L.S.0a.02]|nr:hypothetical protein P886_4683 [Alteromonadaceae bacterium 2753L.S.0a.02]
MGGLDSGHPGPRGVAPPSFATTPKFVPDEFVNPDFASQNPPASTIQPHKQKRPTRMGEAFFRGWVVVGRDAGLVSTIGTELVPQLL